MSGRQLLEVCRFRKALKRIGSRSILHLMVRTMNCYHYTECGLKNVFITGMSAQTNNEDESTTIPAAGHLHRIIAECIVAQNGKMSGRELRFLRTEMGLTQNKLAAILKVKLLTISRWERKEIPIKHTAEMLIRLMAIKRLSLDLAMDVDEVSEKVNLSPQSGQIRIDGSDPNRYQASAA